MQPAERAALRARFDFQCGYCGVSELDVGAELTVDHFHPRSRGGSHTPDNWIYCCHACTEFKGDYWQAGDSERLLHPEHDDMAKHVAEDTGGILQGRTATGAFHIQGCRYQVR